MKLFLFLLMSGTSVFAAQARYTYRSKCYFIYTNDALYNVQYFGRTIGLSNYNCKDAYQELEEECDRKARYAGHSAGSVYKDILVLHKEGSQASSEHEVNSSEHKRHRVFWTTLTKSDRIYHSHSSSQSATSNVDVKYVPVDPLHDCEMNTRIPQQDVPTIRDINLGG